MSKIPDNYKGPGYNTIYDDGMIRQAIAIAEVMIALGVGGGGGGTGGATEATLTQVRDRLPLTLGQNPLAESVSVAIASDQTPVPVSGGMIASSVSFTRPADTTAYAALDTISPATTANLTFSNAARVNGGSGYITKVRLMTNQSPNVARFRLHLFHTAPTAIADNAPYTLLFANAANRIGSLDLPACRTEGSGSNASASSNIVDRLPFVCAVDSRNIIGILQTLDAFTPASGQQFFVELTTDVN